MVDTAPSPRVIRFVGYEVDLRAGQLRKNGLKVKLEGQPLQVLALLLDRPGQLVTRDDVKQQLWGADTFVDFERGINEAVKRLREALDDSADKPRFIETVRGRGYRFIYPLEVSQASPSRRWLVPVALLAGSSLLAILVGTNVVGIRNWLPGKTAAAEIHSLAVLPLENLSGDPEQDYFADGMTDALITELGKITSLRVISRQSVMRYKTTRKPLEEIARDLNVDAVVEGTVVRERDRVSVTAQLIQVRPERHLWAERYDREIRSILVLQSEVAHDIAGEVRAKLTHPEQALLTATRGVNPEAYEAYLKGQFFLDRLTAEGIKKGIDYFQRAINIDPTYAPAYAGLADGYNRATIRGYEPSNEAYPLAKAAVSRALKLDDALTEAHVLAGVIKFRFDWDWAGAQREFDRALQLNPGSSRARVGYGTYLLAIGRVDASIAESQRALDIDPLSPQRYMDLAWKLSYAGRYDEATVRIKRMLELMPDSAIGLANLAENYEFKGMHAEAIATCKKADVSSDTEAMRRCGSVYALGGRRAEARDLLNRLLAKSYVSPYHLAALYDALGDQNEALRWLVRAIETRPPEMCFLKVEPFSPALRADPRFHDLVQRMNFPE